MGGIPPPSALWAVCITPRLMELWATLFAGCGKAAFAFPYAVNSVVHSGMGSYAHFHKSKLRRNPNFLQKRLQIRLFTAKKFGFYF